MPIAYRLLIGVENCRIEDYIHNFLLISGEIILVYQVINLLQLYRISNNKISIVKVISKLLWLCCILIVSAVMAWVGCYWKFFPSFNLPFVLMTSVIVYFPFLVYGFRVLIVWDKIKGRMKTCESKLRDMEGLLH